LRYALVSLLCASADYLIFLCLYAKLHLNLIIAFLISYILVSISGFFALAYFTFRVNKISVSNAFFFVTQLFIVAIIGFVILKEALNFFDAKYAKLIQLFSTFIFSVIYGRLITFNKNNYFIK
jgi:putative flippase GtrA